MEDIRRIVDVAMGRVEADLVIKSGIIVDIIGHDYYMADIAIVDGIIAGIGEYSAMNEIDAKDKYIIPSLIDSHVHIESSMLVPSQYAKVIAQHGVTTIIADPHEIGNVAGIAGLEYMIEDAKNATIDILYMLPSCVPATANEEAGAIIGSKEIKELMRSGKYLGLGEMMNYPGVICCEEEILSKLSQAEYIDGHSPSLTGKGLCAYAGSGIRTDHECESVEELEERIRLGMYVQIREGSQSKNLSNLIKGVNVHNLRKILFCTDDRHLQDLVDNGSISNCITKAIDMGLDPIDAITIASYNPCECYGLNRKGLVAPGYRADICIVNDLKSMDIKATYKDGIMIASKEFAYRNTEAKITTNTISNSVILPNISHLVREFKIGRPCISVRPNSLITDISYPISATDLNMYAVIERYGNSGNIGKAYVDGIGIKNGAIAQSIAHDSHNVSVLGDNEEDMVTAVEALGTVGGMSLVKEGKILHYLPLEVGGLMSNRPYEEVLEEHKSIREDLRLIVDRPGIDPFMLLAFLSLPVIPSIRLTTKGLFDVERFELVE